MASAPPTPRLELPAHPAPWWPYAVACAAIAAATLAQWAIARWVGNEAPFLPFFLAILISAWYGGRYLGLFAAVLSAALATTLFLDPVGRPFILSGHKVFWSIVILAFGGLVSFVCGSLHAALTQAQENLARQIRAEQAAADSEERFRHAFEEAPFPVVLCAEDGAILGLNRAWQDLTGFTLAQLPTMGDWITRAARDPAAAAAAFQRAFAGQGGRVDHGEILALTATGQELVWDFSSAILGALPDGRRFAIAMAKDVTERKRSEEQTRLFRTLVDNVSDGIAIVDPATGRFLDINLKGCTDLGYSREEMLSLTVLDIAPAIDAAAFAANLETLRQGQPLQFETIHRHKDGSTFPTEVSLKWSRLDREYVVAITRDISERKRVEEELRKNESRLHAIVEHMSEGIIISDLEGNLLHWNHAAVQMHDYTASADLRSHLSAFFNQFELATLDGEVVDFKDWPLARLMRGDTFSCCELNIRRRDADWSRTFSYSGNIVEDVKGRPIAFLTITDITEQKRTLERLRRLSTAVEATVNGIVITDVRGTIEWINPAFTRMTGYTADEVVGKNPRILKSGNQDKRFYTELWRTIIAGRVWRGVLCNRRKDGSLYYEDQTITPVRDDKGAIKHFISIKEDMSEKRHLEQQLHQSQKLEAIGRLAGGVAHDFNNLLTVISGYSELMLMKLPANDPARASLKPIHEAAERAAGLTRQLLSFSRQAVVQPVVMSLNDTLREMEKMLRRMIGEDITLTFILDPKVGLIKADEGQIGQVLMNLAVNARDAMPLGGKLTVETANVVLDDSYIATHPGVLPGHYVMLAMTDTGTGMPPDVRARIFEPFFTTKGVGQGTGLGLSVVHGIINQSGGSIEVYTELGIGTTFKVYLPAFHDESLASRANEEAPVSGGSETILLVEDEDAVRAIAILALQSNGYHVHAASSGKEALALYDAHADDIALVVTDVVMPGMSGRELAQTLQARGKPIKVLYVSGYTDDAVVRHGLLQDDVAFLQKPYTPLALARRVREVLDKA